MKRILLISSEFPPGPGGIGTHAYQLAKYLQDQQVEMLVLSPQDYADQHEIDEFNTCQPFTIEQLPSLSNKLFQSLKRFIIFYKILRNNKFDIVVVSGRGSIWMAAPLLEFLDIPWVFVAHGTEFGTPSGLKAFLMRSASNSADGAICVSKYTRQVMHKMGITEPQSFVIHNGADRAAFFPLSKTDIASFRKKHDDDNKFVLLTVGGVSDRKGQEVLIRALPQIKESIPDVTYWIVGLPFIREKLERIAKELGVEDNIRFWGRVSEVELRRIYNSCDLFCMTSRQLADGDFEGFGIAVMEAALCGKAAVVSDNSGLAEAVIDGETGILVPQNDSDKTAKAIIKLANDPSTLDRLSQNAYLNAIENQTWEQVGKRYLNVLKMFTGSSAGECE